MAKFYHVTYTDNLPSIRQGGLVCRRGKGLTSKTKYRSRVYLFRDSASAREFIIDSGSLGLPRSVSLLEVDVPPGTKLRKDTEMYREDKPDLFPGVYLHGSIPSSRIRVLETYPEGWFMDTEDLDYDEEEDEGYEPPNILERIDWKGATEAELEGLRGDLRSYRPYSEPLM